MMFTIYKNITGNVKKYTLKREILDSGKPLQREKEVRMNFCIIQGEENKQLELDSGAEQEERTV